ncbi:hypothetical protein FA13DRAFT_1754073 [Coprinellus micaceus]|uniref:LsmAD domain-containing protein n=1 Tax=Coprinellus micaceus TaxID=71717 RepID=A0A4Y7THC9_COPMI|nr:hypothetical protein FA13DRAFT_1754073 [Coprinellus micaceus]
MASTARQPKPPKRGGGPDPARCPIDDVPRRRRPQAWTGARASPTFSPSNTPRPPSTTHQQQQPQPGPPLAHPNGLRPDPARDRVLLSLTGLTGTTVTLTTRTGQRYEGVVGSTGGEGDTTGVTLKDVKDLTTAGAPLKDSLFIASTNIDSYLSGPADARPTTTNGNGNGDTFRTDTDISARKPHARERELQAWVPPPVPSSGGLEPHGSTTTTTNTTNANDEDTFGLSATGPGSWDQFTANEQLFGVTVNFDEEAYTTTIDRNAPDFKERERKAQRIANEIMGTATNNPHVAEERGQAVDDSGVNEEDKYGAVVRGQNAYVPPGARRGNNVANGAPALAPVPVAPKTDVPVPKVSINGPDGAAVATGQSPVPSKASSPAPGGNKPPADPLPAFRDFVTHEKQRLTQKRQALVKSEMDKRMAELVKFSQSFKLNKPIPDDLVPILAKDEEKQKAIKEKAKKDAESTEARAIGASTPATASRGVLGPQRAKGAQIPASKTVASNLGEHGAATQKGAGASTSSPRLLPPPPVPGEPGTNAPKKISMFIAAIPPFKGARSGGKAQATTSGASTSSAGTPPVKVTASGSNVHANTNGNGHGSGPGATPIRTKADSAPATPNPFFGPRVLKKGTPVNVKDDFNPFKHNKVVDASQVAALWPYNGKRYLAQYPLPPHQPPQHAPHAPGPVVASPMPPQGYDEDPAAAQAQAQAQAQAAQAAAARGYVYAAYPPYGYPGGPMMPGMPPGPPGAYMQGHFMPPMPYGPGMPPPNAMYSPAMGQMPPPGAYMSPPPVQHAVPYPMMMPPPGPPPGGPPHPYDGQQQQQPVQMGGHA